MPLDRKDIDRMVTTYREDYHPDVEEGLASLHAKLAAAPTSVSKSHARRRFLIYISAAAAAMLLLFGISTLLDDGLLHLTTDGEQLAVHHLPDGSMITLQGGSEITFDPEKFNVADRRVSLTGQAFFEVHPDAARPFLVDNGVSRLRVTGTAFNLRSEKDLLEVEVSEGTVVLGQGDEQIEVTIKECGLAESGKRLQSKPAPNLNHHAWRTGNLKFERTPVSEVFSYFKANWDIECSWLDGACEYPVSGSYRGREAVDVLADVAKLGGLTLTVDEKDPKHFIFSGNCAG